MSEETKLEVIKALAYGEEIETIANMAETEPEEIERIREQHADEVGRRRKAIAGGAEDGD